MMDVFFRRSLGRYDSFAVRSVAVVVALPRKLSSQNESDRLVELTFRCKFDT